MKNISSIFHNHPLPAFFVKSENQNSQSLTKRILLASMGIFAIMSTAFLVKRYLKNGVASKQENGEKEDQKAYNKFEVTPRRTSIDSLIVNTGNSVNSISPINSEPEEILRNLFQQLDQAPQLIPIARKSDVPDESPELKDQRRLIYHQEIERFNNCLMNRLKSPVEKDLTYVCIGHGRVSEQIWPGFLFETLQSGKTVETYLIEDRWKYSNSVFTDLLAEYHNYLKADPNKEAMQNLNHLSVQQFVCGFPDTQLDDNCYEESMNDQDKEFYYFLTNIFWKSRQQAIGLSETFNQYIEKILIEGKTVVLGDHRGQLLIDDSIVVLYNKMVEKYPGQISFLWAWKKCNLMTSQSLKAGDFNPTNHSSPWTYHEKLSATTLNSLER